MCANYLYYIEIHDINIMCPKTPQLTTAENESYFRYEWGTIP